MNIRSHAASLLAITAACLTGNVIAAAAVKIDFDKDAIKPTPVQSAVIRRAAVDDIKEFNDPNKDDWVVAQADLNDDGHPDLLVQYTGDSGFCGSTGCSGLIVMATANGYAGNALDGLPNFYGEIDILANKHHGMHDLSYGGYSHHWKWDGKHYR